MKHTIITKFLAILLVVLSLGSTLAGLAGIDLLESAGLYVNSLDNLQDYEYDSIARNIAGDFANLYAVKNLGDIPYLLQQELYDDPQERNDAEYWCTELYCDGVLLETEGSDNGSKGSHVFSKTYTFEPTYPVHYQEPETPEPEEEGEVSDDPDEPVEKPTDYLYKTTETLGIGFNTTNYELYYYQAPEYSVTVYMQEQVLDSSRLHLLTAIYPARYTCIAVVIVGLLIFAANLVYLLWVSGRTPDGQVLPAGLNLIPLDLYLVAGCIGVWLLLLLFDQAQQWVMNTGPHFGNLTILFVNLLGILLIPVGFLAAVSAQLKLKEFYWWTHSITGFLLARLWKALKALGSALRKCLQMMPVIWQWFAVYGAMVCLLALGFWAAQYSGWGIAFLILVILASVALVLYSGYSFGTLLQGIRKMSGGELTHKIPTEHMGGSFRECAAEMNALSEAAMQAVQSQVRSERMKTELITNVSHDIKTPLTSIINFVDLLGRPHSKEADEQYLEILSRQSQQLKKLIEDLMELSKASSGNLQATIITMDATESVNQALGEFSDKLEQAGLTTVFYPPQEPVLIAADGRMTWRVLANLLSNAVKYATPGTRMHVEICGLEDTVQISIKNVSKEELRLSAEDLLERFVRGDASRNREGSGLGLNIAKSLMEVQNGSLQLTLDGDLFKVTLTFPKAQQSS